jgi:hypothetical protein
MDHSRSTSGNSFPTRQSKILDAVVNYGYFAPRMLAFEEAYERIHYDYSLGAQIAAESAVARRPLVDVDVVRRRLGEILILVATRLQGIPAIAPGDPSQVAANSRL